MGLMDILGRYANPQERGAPQTIEDFERVSQEASPDDLCCGLEDAFKSETTPPFEQMVGQLYGRSDPQQRAGLLNEIMGSLGGGAAGGLMGGALGDLFRSGRATSQVSPEDASHIPVTDVEVAAAEAAKRNPGIVERVSKFYAQHPQLVQTLGQVALGIAMSGMARRRRF